MSNESNESNEELNLNNVDDHEAIAKEIVDSSYETQSVPMAIYKDGTYGIYGLGSDNIIWPDDVAVITIPAYYSDINDIVENLWRDLLPAKGDISPAAYDLIAKELELIAADDDLDHYGSEAELILAMFYCDYPDARSLSALGQINVEISDYFTDQINAIAEDALSHGLNIVFQAVEALADLKERGRDNA